MITRSDVGAAGHVADASFTPLASDLRVIAETPHIGRIVSGCLVGGLVVALALVVGPVGGAQEHVITGTILLTFAASWALLGTLSMVRTGQPQRWALGLASFMALAGAPLLRFSPRGVGLYALGVVWA